MAVRRRTPVKALRRYRRRWGWVLAFAVVVSLVGGLSDRQDRQQQAGGVTAQTEDSAPAGLSSPLSPTLGHLAPVELVDGADAAESVALLATLPVKGRAPMTGYDRELFGSAWSDDVTVEGGGNGCDTRNDVLRRDLVDLVIKTNSNGCVVQSGILHDPYTGNAIAFVRGADTSAAVQVDHVVALADAWQKGAQQLPTQQRVEFANDPLNLQATEGAVNQAKGAGDAATWLPPNKQYRCTYVARQVAVKAKYQLWVTVAERDAMMNVLSSCSSL